jgi:hypothetical protein
MYGWTVDDIAADDCIDTFDSILVGCGVRPAGSRGFDDADVTVVAVFDGRYGTGCGGDVTNAVGRLPRWIFDEAALLLLFVLGKRAIGS